MERLTAAPASSKPIHTNSIPDEFGVHNTALKYGYSLPSIPNPVHCGVDVAHNLSDRIQHY